MWTNFPAKHQVSSIMYLWMCIFILINSAAFQPYGPTEQQHLSTPNAHQEFCVYQTRKYVHPNVHSFKSITLPESEQCTLYCTLEPNCFFAEYNPTNEQCKMFSFFTICGNYRSKSYELLLSWKAHFIPQEQPTAICDHHALRNTIGYGGECTALSGKTRQSYNDAQYYYRYGAITGVRLWKKGYFRAIQFRYGDVWAPVRGPDDGIIPSSFTLVANVTFERGEYIYDVYAGGGYNTKHVKFVTTKGRVIQTGNAGKIGSGYFLYITGTNTARLDSLQHPCYTRFYFLNKC